MKHLQNQKGFSIVEVLVLIVTIAIIGLASCLVYWNHHKPAKVVAAAKAIAAPSKTTTSSSSTTPSGPGYAAAKKQWLQTVNVLNTANQNPSVQQVVTDLKNGLNTDKNTSEYNTAISNLEVFLKIPETDVTAAQNAQFNTALNYLNTFFDTPNI